MSAVPNFSADNGGAGTGKVAFNYTVVEDGLKKLMTLGGNLEEFVSQLKSFRDLNPDVWTGKDHELYETIMADAEKGLNTTNENITSISTWLTGAQESAQSNEARNTSLLGNAYSAVGR